MRALLVAALVALCAAPVAAQHARQRHGNNGNAQQRRQRPDHGRIIREQPRHHGPQYRPNHGYRQHGGYGYRLQYGYRHRGYGYQPYYGSPYGYGGYYGYRSAPLCTYWTRGYTAPDWYGNLVWVPPQPYVAACW